MYRSVSLFLGSLIVVAAASPALAADVNLSAVLSDSCVLTLGSGGVMTPASSGTVIGSEQSGGSAAVLTVVAIGAFPTIAFSAPSLTTSPPGWTGSPTNEIRYTSTGGANQAYTALASERTATTLNDTFTIHGRVTNTTGFAAGTYNLRSVATCSQ